MAIDLNDLATAISQLVLRFRLRRRTAADWTATNEVLYGSEMGHESDTNKVKIGDGTTAWNSLKYFVGVTLVAGSGVSINNADPTAPVISASGSGGGGGSNMTPDTHPGTPTAWDDEFEYGSAIDTTGARETGANAWTQHLVSGVTALAVADGYVYGESGTGNILLIQAVPSSGDCAFTCKVKRPTINGNVGWQLNMMNIANGNSYSVQLSNSPSIVTERDTFNTSTWVMSGVSNPFTDSTRFPYGTTTPWMWLRLRISGTNIIAGWSDTGHPNDFYEPTTEGQASFLGARPTHVGIHCFKGMKGLVDWFRRTA